MHDQVTAANDIRTCTIVLPNVLFHILCETATLLFLAAVCEDVDNLVQFVTQQLQG